MRIQAKKLSVDTKIILEIGFLILCIVILGLATKRIWLSDNATTTPNEYQVSVVLNNDVLLQDTGYEQVTPSDSAAPAPNLTAEQQHILRLAYKIGSEIGYPETIQAIALQETRAGEYGNGVGDRNEPVGFRSYGVMQVKVATARFVFHHYPDVFEQLFGKTTTVRRTTDEEIIVLLISDNEANILIGALNFELMLERTDSWATAVVAYNGGLGFARSYIQKYNPQQFKYVKEVNRWIVEIVRPFNITRTE